MDNAKYLILAIIAGVILLGRRSKAKAKPGEPGTAAAAVPHHSEVQSYPDGKTNEEAARKVLQQIVAKYGVPMARNIERMYRLETASFNSMQYRKTYSPGMESHGLRYPWGWTTLARGYWKEYPHARPVGKLSMRENSNELRASQGEKVFLIFPSLSAAMHSVAYQIQAKGRPGAWFSNDQAEQEAYERKLLSLPTPIIDNIYS